MLYEEGQLHLHKSKFPQPSWSDRLAVRCKTITTNVVSLNPAHGEVYSIQRYVIKFVSDLGQVGGILLVLRFPPSTQLTATKLALNTMLQNPKIVW